MPESGEAYAYLATVEMKRGNLNGAFVFVSAGGVLHVGLFRSPLRSWDALESTGKKGGRVGALEVGRQAGRGIDSGAVEPVPSTVSKGTG